MTGVCMFVPFFSFFFFFFFFLVKEKERKEKERTTVAAIPSHQFSISAVDGFPSPKKMTWIVMSSLFVKGSRASQSVSQFRVIVDDLLQKCKKAIRQKNKNKNKKKLTSLAAKTAAAPSSPPVIDPRPRPPTRSSLDASLRSRPPRQRISGRRGAGRCSSDPLPVSALAVHRSGPERSASPWTVGAGVLVPGRAFRASGRRARRLGRW